MRFPWMAVPIALAVLGPGASPWGLGQSSTTGSSGQTPKKSTSAQSAALTPQEKEAQKHYRIALEAIKNNDFTAASDELKTAADLAPKNALIWYNLAVVESKKGDSKSALEHLQKAESLGLPRNLQNDAEQLDAKLSYAVGKDIQRKADELKREQLSKQIHTLLDGLVGALHGYECRRDNSSGSTNLSGYGQLGYSGICELSANTSEHTDRSLVISPGNGAFYVDDKAERIQLHLADVSPDVSVLPEQIFKCNAEDYELVIRRKSNQSKPFPATLTVRHSEQHWVQGTQQPATVTGEEPTNFGENLVKLYFRGSDAANDAAGRISSAVRLCTGETEATPAVK